MAFSLVSLCSPGFGGGGGWEGQPEGSDRGGGRRVSKLGLRTIVSLCSVNTKCIILSSSSQLTAGTEKQHLKVAAGEC